MTLLLVDGSNILMRCAFGGDIAPAQSTPTAAGMIERAASQLGATHLMIALDFPGHPTWRHLAYPPYKGNRTRDTSAWLIEGASEFGRRHWHCEVMYGFEADDIIATIALRARTDVIVLSNDSDLLVLTAWHVGVAKPLTGGGFALLDEGDVREKFDIPSAASLVDFKAMTGETGDNIPGVPGVGATRAATLIKRHGSLEEIITAGAGGYDKYSELVATHRDVARLARSLVALRTDVPIEPIAPRRCVLPMRGPRFDQS